VVTKQHLKKPHLQQSTTPQQPCLSEKTGYLTEFEKGQIVALRKKILLFLRLEALSVVPRAQFKVSTMSIKRGVMRKNLPFTGRPKLLISEPIAT
jgi:hypothetical protein